MKFKINLDQVKDIIIDETPFWDNNFLYSNEDDNVEYKMYWDFATSNENHILIFEDKNGNKVKYEVSISLKKKKT